MKKTKVIGIILGCILLFSACGNDQREIYDQSMGQIEQTEQIEQADQVTESEAETPESKELTGEITFRIPVAYTEKMLAEEFTALHPGVTITFLEHEVMDEEDLLEFADLLAVEMMSGNAADICDLSLGDYVQWSRSGLLRDLNELIDSDPTFRREDYFTNVFEAVEVDGKLYGLPFGFNTSLVWLDKPMMEALDVDLSQYDGISIPQVMDLYEEAEQKGLLPAGYVLEEIYPTYLNGKERGVYYDGREGWADFENPEYIRFLDRLTKMIKDPKEKWKTVVGHSDNQYPKNENSFMFSSWYLDAAHILWYEQSSEKWTAPIPLVRSDGKREFDCSMYGISSDSDNAELAWEFLKYCISEKKPEDYGTGSQDVWYKDIFYGLIPINRLNTRHMAEYMYAGTGVNEEVYDKFVGIAEQVDTMDFVSKDLMKVWGSLDEDFFTYGLLTVEEYVRQLQERTELNLQE